MQTKGYDALYAIFKKKKKKSLRSRVSLQVLVSLVLNTPRRCRNHCNHVTPYLQVSRAAHPTPSPTWQLRPSLVPLDVCMLLLRLFGVGFVRLLTMYYANCPYHRLPVALYQCIKFRSIYIYDLTDVCKSLSVFVLFIVVLSSIYLFLPCISICCLPYFSLYVVSLLSLSGLLLSSPYLIRRISLKVLIFVLESVWIIDRYPEFPY